MTGFWDHFDFGATLWWRVLILNALVFFAFVLLSAWHTVNGAMDRGMNALEALADEPRKLAEAFVAYMAVCLIPYVQVALLSISAFTLVVMIYLLSLQNRRRK